MKEDVLIILNDSEQIKKDLAEKLCSNLREKEFCAEPLSACSKLEVLIEERNPKVLVLDYLLGSYGTALDLIPKIKDNPNAPKIIIWTDEPSVSVAVSAIKQGCEDYFEINAKASLEKVTLAVEALVVQQNKTKALRRAPKEKNIVTVVGENKLFREALTLAESVALQNLPIVIISGDLGSGRSYLAEYIHTKRLGAGEFQEIEYDIWTGNPEDVCGGYANQPALLDYAKTLVIDHVEYDDGQLLKEIEKQNPKIQSSRNNISNSMLIIGINNPEVALAWRKVLDAEIIQIPPLAERKEDFLPLTKHLFQEALALLKIKKFDLPSELISTIEEQEWPGNVKQLKASITDGLAIYGTDPKKDLLELVINANLRWKKLMPTEIEVDASEARKVYQRFSGDIRLAAIALGTGIPNLREALKNND